MRFRNGKHDDHQNIIWYTLMVAVIVLFWIALCVICGQQK